MIILPSLLAASQLKLHQAISNMLDLGLSHLHIDMMDYHFTHNFGLTPSICREIIKTFPEVTLDVHLMTNPTPTHLIEQLSDMGITDISVHTNTLSKDDLLRLQNTANLELRIALLPTENIADYLNYKKLLILAVNPGFSHQALQQNALHNAKIAASHHIDTMFDGGVNISTAHMIKDAQPSSVVVGGGLFGKSKQEQQSLITLLTDPQD